MDPNENIARHLWAKTEPFHYLWRHLLDAAAVAEMLLPRFVPEGSLPLSKLWLCYLVAMHDIGKADPLFQFKAWKYVIWEGKFHPVFIPEFAARVDFDAWVEAKLNSDVKREKTEGFRHEARSADWLWQVHLTQTHGWSKKAADVVITTIRGHHADFRATAPTEETYTSRRWNPIRDVLAKLVANAIGLDKENVAPPQDFSEQNTSRVGLILSGLIVLADWIASNDALFPFRSISHLEDPAEYFAAARDLAAKAVKRLQFDTVTMKNRETTPKFNTIWSGGNYDKLRPTQTTLEMEVLQGNVPPGLGIIEAPMGEGKTEAAIYLAEIWNRMTGRVGSYIALPTQATSNQMFTRYEKFVKNTRPQLKPRLLHGMAWLREEESEDEEKALSIDGAPQTYGAENDPESERAREWFFDNSKRGLLAPESVGTIDQVLFAALNVRHGFLRLFGLSTRTLIIDEVHASDDFMSAILCRLLLWLHTLRVPTILLSATLSQVQKKKLLYAWNRTELPEKTKVAYPLITLAPFDAPAKSEAVEIDVPIKEYDRTSTVHLKTVMGGLGNTVRTADIAASLVKEGGCLCVLANTVVQAQDIFAELKMRKEKNKLPNDCELLLFHARFPVRRRNEIEKEVLKRFGKAENGAVNHSDRPRCAILLATQVVEQSLDVDFDTMISEIAPIDLLLQRSGRLHRHAGRIRPEPLQEPILYILVPEKSVHKFGKTGGVYHPYVLLRTLAKLIENENGFVFHAPGDFRTTIEAVYGETSIADPAIAAAADREKDEWIRETSLKKYRGEEHLIAEPEHDLFCYDPHKPMVEEDAEGELSRSYFRAKTRDDNGPKMRSVICLLSEEDKKAWDTVSKTPDKKYPPRKILKHLFLCKATVPADWLEGVPDMPDGTKPPRWLNHHTVLCLQSERDENNKIIRFRFEDAAGIVRLYNDETKGFYDGKQSKNEE